MRATLAWAYITEPGTAVGVESGCLIIRRHGRSPTQWPMESIDGVVAAGGVHFTTPALRALLRRGAPLSFVSARGGSRGRLAPTRAGMAQVRLLQYRLAGDATCRLALARAVVVEKVWAMRAVLARYQSNYSVHGLPWARRRLDSLAGQATRCDSPDRLLGVEGAAAAIYWGVFRKLNRSPLPFGGRAVRPPRDPVNALLSLAYTLLTHNAWSLLEAHGLDPQLGFYHQVHGSRPSLVLDLIEPLRHVVVDRAVLRMINLGQFTTEDFVAVPGGVHVARRAWPRLIEGYEHTLDARPLRGDVPDTLEADTWRTWLRRRCLRMAHQLAETSEATASV